MESHDFVVWCEIHAEGHNRACESQYSCNVNSCDAANLECMLRTQFSNRLRQYFHFLISRVANIAFSLASYGFESAAAKPPSCCQSTFRLRPGSTVRICRDHRTTQTRWTATARQACKQIRFRLLGQLCLNFNRIYAYGDEITVETDQAPVVALDSFLAMRLSSSINSWMNAKSSLPISAMCRSIDRCMHCCHTWHGELTWTR